MTFTGGRTTNLSYDLTGSTYNAAGAPDASKGYLSKIEDSSGITLDATNWTVGYDATGRITSFNDSTSGGSGATSGFTYDANGNRLTSSQSPGPVAGITSSRTYSITANTNRLASYSQTDVVSGSPVNTTTTFSINANGDTTGDGTKTYGFHVESRLASTGTGSSPTVSTSRYSHNALGQRTFKTLPVTTSPSAADPGYAFVYDEDGTLIGEYGATGTPSAGTTEYIWLPSPNGPVPVAAVINGAIFAIQADHLNTPRRLSNTSAQAVWQWKYSAFGDEQPTLAANRFADLAMNPNPGTTTTPPVTFNLRYPGQYADAESGLYYNYFRSYNSDTGGYTQADPIGLDGGWNRFGYVEASPLAYVDPMGLWAWGDPIDQSIVDGATGFGDGAYKAITLGIGDLQAIRDLAGIDGDIDQCSRAYEAFKTTGTVVGGAALGGASLKALGNVAGPLKQWIRVGGSYSRSSGQSIALSIRWGASPAGGGRYIRQIPSQTLRNFNQWLRDRSIPFSGWRGMDPGHFHLLK